MRIPEAYRSLARKARWHVAPFRGGHLRWSSPDGTVVVTAATPSDWRASRNARARLRKAGLREGTRP